MALKGLEHDAQDKIPRDIKRKLQDVSQLLHKSLRLNNIILTEIQRKRKSDIYQSLGEKFKLHAKYDSSEDYLFDEKTMKRMNESFYKTQKSWSHRDKSNQHYNQWRKY